MGIKIRNIISRKRLYINSLKGSIIAIDAPNIVFSLFSFTQMNSLNDIMVDSTQQAFMHLYNLLYRVKYLYSKSIMPIFCFDGKESELKRKIPSDKFQRYNYKKHLYETCIKRGRKDLAKKLALSPDYFWIHTINEAKELLYAIGVPVVESPSSAEAQCAELVRTGVADYSNSYDYDVLLYGSKRNLINLTKSRKQKVSGKNKYCSTPLYSIDLENNLKNMNINMFQLIDLSILVGTDFFGGIRKIGEKTALKLIQHHKSLETVISKNQTKYDFTPLSYNLFQKIRKIFLFPEVHSNIGSLQWRSPDIKGIRQIMCERHTLNEERVQKNSEQLESYFTRSKRLFEKNSNVEQRKILEFA